MAVQVMCSGLDLCAAVRKVIFIDLVSSSDEEDADKQEPSDLEEAQQGAAAEEVPTPAQAERQDTAGGAASDQEQDVESDRGTGAAAASLQELQDTAGAEPDKPWSAVGPRRNPSRRGRPEEEGQLSLNYLQAQG